MSRILRLIGVVGLLALGYVGSVVLENSAETATPDPGTLLDQSYAAFKASSPYKSWAKQNPKEAARVDAFWAQGGTPPATATQFGLALSLEKQAQIAAAPAPPPTETTTTDPVPPPPPPATTATRYVTTTGSDAGTCTQTAPCKTFNRAYQVASPGEIVDVAAGTYPPQNISEKTGAVGPAVVIREAPGARVIVGASGRTTDCISTDASWVELQGFETTYTTVGGMQHQCSVAIGRGGDHITFRDLDVGMVWISADDVSIIGGDYGPGVDQNSKISESGPCGSRSCPSKNILFDGVRIHDALRYQDHQECLALWGGDGVTVRNSTFDNCAVFHIWIVAESDYNISNVLIENNTFAQSNSAIEANETIATGDHGGDLNNVVIRNNTVLTGRISNRQGTGGGGGSIQITGNKVVNPVTGCNQIATCSNNTAP